MVGVSLRRGERAVLHDIDVTVPSVGITVLVGPSGSGKSSLLRLANRLEEPDSGVVRVLGDDVRDRDPLALRRQVGMVFQRPTPFAGTVRDNLLAAAPDAETAELARKARDGKLAPGDIQGGTFSISSLGGIGGTNFTPIVNAPDAETAELADALRRAGLDEGFLDREATQLSGGESQRMCLARALAAGPRVLLMDEPTSALDADATTIVERTGRALADAGVPLLWVTHDLAQAARIADHVICLDDGRVVGAGRPEDLLDSSASEAPDGR